MRAATYDRFGPTDVLRVAERPDPSPDDVVVEVTASSVNPKDTFVRKGRFRRQTGSRFPMGTGYDFSGTVVDSRTADLPVGTAVFGMIRGWRGRTAADLVSCSRDEVAAAPASIPLADAAAIPLAALTALQALRDCAGLRPGQHVVINGASGGVGSFAVQIAKAMGAEVTAVCSAASASRCLDLGADRTHDYAQGRLPDGEEVDVVFDVFGNLARAEALDRLVRGGRHVTTVPSVRTVAAALLTRTTSLVVVKPRASDLAELAALVDSGRLRADIDARYDLTDIAAAHAHVEGKHTQGKVLVIS